MMEESVAATLDHEHPIEKRKEEIGSGSKEEASRKAEVEELDDSGVPDFKTHAEFLEYCGDFNDRYALYYYQKRMTRRCELKEIRYFLTSKGQADQAEIIQSEEDLDEEELKEFRAKNWKINPMVGPYDDYQRLVVWDNPLSCNLFSDFFFSYEYDVAFPGVFDKLKEVLQKIPSFPDARRTAQDLCCKYFDEITYPFAIDFAVEQLIRWWSLEDLKKQMIPILSKLCHEVLKEKRSIEEVVNETLGQVVGPFTRAETYILSDAMFKYRNTREIVNQLERYFIREDIKIVDDEILLEQFVERFMEEDPPYIVRFTDTYADYSKLKLLVAKRLGII